MLLAALAATALAGSLQFGWTAGAEADVTYAIEGTRAQPFGTLTFTRTATYHATVADEGGNLALQRTGWTETARKTTPASVGGLVVQDWVDDLQARLPTVILKTDGDYVGVGGGDALRAAASKDFDTVQLDPGTRAALDGMVSDPSLTAVGGDWWAFAGALWRKHSDQTASTFSHTNRAPIPALGGELDLVTRFEVVGPADCAPGKAGCIELKATTAPDAEQLAALLAKNGLDAFEMSQQATLVTEPATLRPHKLTILRGSKGAGTDESITRTWTWSWAEQP